MGIERLGRGHRSRHVLWAPRGRWGGLRRPAALHDGWSRGEPVDRVYIDRFLSAHRARVTGEVLEVQSSVHTERFGVGVTGRHVVDLDERPGVTVVADLSLPGALPTGAYDCILLPQTLQFVPDPGAAVANAVRALRPGGSLIVTVPGISRTRAESLRPDAAFADLWRWTAQGLARLLASDVPADRVVVESLGNAATTVAFLHGLGAGELRPDEYDPLDPAFPLVVGGVATRVG